MSYLVAVGACYLDTILSVPYYPEEDEKLRATSMLRRRGGNCPNTLEVLHDLVDCFSSQNPSDICLKPILSVVLPSSTSPALEEIRTSFRRDVDLSYCTYREDYVEPASSYIIKSGKTQSRTIVNYNELPETTTRELQALIDKIGNKACWWHFEGRIPETTLQCLHYLRSRSNSVKISVEIEKPRREGLQELAAEADVIFYSKSWAMGNGYKDAEECLKAQASLTKEPALLCCTWGSHGVTALEKPGYSFGHAPAFKVPDRPVIEWTKVTGDYSTVGAGDTFVAGMLFALNYQANYWDIDRMLQFSTELAGYKVMQEGFANIASKVNYQGYESLPRPKEHNTGVSLS